MDAAPAAEIRLLALGDSYTIGEGVLPSDRWPVRLSVLLRARAVRLAEPTIVAKTGWSTDELSRGLDEANLTGPFNVVTLLIGVNDQYRGRPAEEYRDRLRTLIARAIRLAGGEAAHVIVISIPDWGVTPFAATRDRARIAAEIDAYNAVNAQEASRAGTRYVDVTPLSRRAAGDRFLTASDGLHPSGAMYADWTRLLLPVVQAVVSDRR